MRGKGRGAEGQLDVEPQALGHAQRANFSSLTGRKEGKNRRRRRRRSWQHCQVVSVADEAEREGEGVSEEEGEGVRERGRAVEDTR